MWLIMLSRLLHIIFFSLLFGFELYISPQSAVLFAFLVIIAVGLLMLNVWWIALIGDVTGTRRVLGITVVSDCEWKSTILGKICTDERFPQRRKGLDIFLHVMAVINLAVDGSFIFWATYGIALASVWLFLGIPIFIVAMMASTEPIDEYGVGMGVGV